jgi:DNA-binding MarR family transcriptional regulator
MELNDKIVYGLERLSEVFKTLLWDKAKKHGISPIQIQLLLFISEHSEQLCNVSKLAREFNLTKPTVSDAIKVLNNKGFLIKDYSSTDQRSYSLGLSNSGKQLMKDISDYNQLVKKALRKESPSALTGMFSTLSKLIFELNQMGVLKVQRTCFACRFYTSKNKEHYCNLLETNLKSDEIRLDCQEFESH